MPIEKVFAIKAPPEAIWRALTDEVAQAGQHAAVERSEPPRVLALRLEIGGVPAVITYLLTPTGADTEVAARLEPLGLRYLLFQGLTLGRFRTNFELLLVQGLANLKQAVEGGDPEELPGPDEA